MAVGKLKFPGRSRTLSPIPQESLDDGKRVFFEASGAPTVNGNRWFIVAMVLAASVTMLSIAIWRMLPLKSVMPYIVKVSDSGYVAADPAAAKKYVPGEREKRYFLAKWVRQVYLLDPSLTVKNLKDAWSITSGDAVAEFRGQIKKDNPIGKITNTPQNIRAVDINSVSFVGGNTSLVRFTTSERGSYGKERDVKHLIATIHFHCIPPQTASEILTNPIGLQITNFDITEDINNSQEGGQ
ncbi:MAG TPA: hypothetical protein DEP05_06200 [Betaproteobacteria bacterium]|nr:hypothetical protein [Betaproteobacteria bacterium]